MQPRPITANDAASSSANGVGTQKIITGTPTAGSTVAAMIANNPPRDDVVFSFSGTFSATAEVELSEDGGTTWLGPCSLNPVGGGNAVTTMNAPGVVSIEPGVATNARARCIGYSNGTMLVSMLPGIPPELPAAPILFVRPGTTRNDLTWRAIPGATGYNVYRGTAAGAETLLAANQTGPTYANTSLTPNTAYYYYVTTVNAVGESIASNEAVGLVVPAAPTSPAATGTASNIGLTWTAPSGGATSYNVYRGTATGAQNTTPIATGITATAYTDSNVIFGTTYYYTVKSANAGGESVASTEVSASATGQAAPTSVAGTASSGTQIDLTWVAAAGAATYNLYRGTTSGGEAVAPIATKLTGTSHSDTGLTSGTTYYYKMTALSSVGQSIKSNEVAIYAGVIPGAPTSILATPATGALDVTWTAPAGLVSTYTVYRSVTTGTEASFKTGILVPSYVDQSCVPSVTYFYKATATNPRGEGPLSTESAVKHVTAGDFPGTLTNSPTYTASVPTAISTFVTSLAFVGASTEYVACGGTVANDLNQFTLCARFKTSDSSHLTVLAARGANSHQAWTLYNNSGSIGFVTNTAAGANIAGVDSDPGFADGAWHDVQILVDGIYQTLNMYIDGVLVAGAWGAGTWNSNDTSSLLTWANKVITSPSPFTGSLCDCRIYAELLSTTDIAAYHAGTPVSVVPVCWYKMNENTGSTALDSGISWYVANVVFDGNSLTAGSHISDATQFYPARAGAMLALITGTNEGVGGQTTETMDARFNAVIAPLFNGGIAKNVIVAWEGINSMSAGAQDDTPAAAYAAMTSYIAKAHTAGFKVLVLSMIKCDPVVVDETKRLAYNALVMANSGGADAVFDLGAQAEFQDISDTHIYYVDEIHLVAAGAAVVARYVMQQLVLIP